MKKRSRFGRWGLWLGLAAALAAAAPACRTEPTPRTRKGERGAKGERAGRGGARGAVGYAAAEGEEGAYDDLGAAVPTACTDEFRKGGLPIGNAPRKGSADAIVAIVEFANLECADCAKLQGKVDEILNRYPDDVALFYVNAEGSAPAPQAGQPMPPRQGRAAAQAALTAGQTGKFWQFVERANASPGKLAAPDLEQYAQQVGLDVNGFRSQMNSRAVMEQVDAGQAVAIELGIRGPLPVFWVNGEQVSAKDAESRLAEVVERELDEARRALAAPRSRCEVLARYVTSRQLSGAAASPRVQRPQRPQEDPNAVYKVPVGDSPARGPADALATLVLFTDFQCPFCARVTPTLEQLLEAYPQDLRLVFKNNALPGHDHAQITHEAAMAAKEQGKFWEYHDKVFHTMKEYYDNPNRDPNAPHPLDREALEKYAEELGLNMGQFRRSLDEHTGKAAIDADMTVARQFNITGTPTFVLNGKKFSGALPLEQFKARVDQAIAEAKKLVDAGTPRAQVYEKIIAAGSDRAIFLPMPAGDQAPPREPPPRREAPPMPSEVKDVKTEAWNPARGPANAKVTVVLFCEYLCPYCRRVQPTLQTLLQAYGNDVRVVYRSHIVHPPAEPASLASLAAMRQGQEKWQAFHDLMFANQGQARDRAGIEALAEQAGLNMERLRADMDSAEIRAQLDADKAEAGRLGVTGTPTLFINGRMLVGAVPPSWFGKWIDQLLGRTTPTIPESADAAQGPAPTGGCGAAAAPAPSPMPALNLRPVAPRPAVPTQP
jgi:protein-disulfide isomerase